MHLENVEQDKIYILEEIYKSNINYFKLENPNIFINYQYIMDDLQLGNDNISNYFIKLDDTYVGFIQVMLINPSDSCTWIGLLLIHHDYQNYGLGTNAINLLLNNYSKKGYKVFRVGVLLDNTNANKFWKRLNFNYIENKISNIGIEVEVLEFKL
ncbi:MAG: acetyltransferase, family [Bacillales bacterium]|jgi:predicted acetyltransferase|nr:acetyltransferase, family [Bacillales bacterium]